MIDLHTWMDQLEDAFLEQGDEEYAIGVSRYFRNQFESFGLKNAVRRALARPYLQALKAERSETILELLQLLWLKPQRDFQHTGMELLHLYRKKFNADILAPLEFVLTHKAWWDTVDMIASHTVGWAYQNGFLKLSDLRRWNESGHLWLVRSSIIFQLKYKQQTDWPLLQEMMASHLLHPDFFIRKAIGWALRQYSYTAPQRVLDYLETHEMSGLSRREALKGLARGS